MGKIARPSSFVLLPVKDPFLSRFLCLGMALLFDSFQRAKHFVIEKFFPPWHTYRGPSSVLLSRPGPLVPSKSSSRRHGSRSPAWPSTAPPTRTTSQSRLWKACSRMQPCSRGTAGGGSTNSHFLSCFCSPSQMKQNYEGKSALTCDL